MPSFDSWMQKVDSAVMRRSGVSVHDLADQCFYDWYNDGITPVQAARLTLENEGF